MNKMNLKSLLKFVVIRAIRVTSLLLCLNAFSQTTPVLIPLNSLFGGQAYNKPLTITAANSVVWDGSQFWAGTYTVVPASATNPIVSLYPASYLLTIPGVVPAVRFNVPPEPVDGSNGPAVWTMVPSSGPAVYFGTNILASLQFGAGMSFVTNANGSVTVSVGSVPLSELPSFGVGSLSGWLPSMAVTSAVAFYNPGIFTSLSNGAYIPTGSNAWPDLSGNGNNLSLLGQTYFLDSAGLNGKPALRRLYNTFAGVSPCDFVCTNLFANNPELGSNGAVIMVVYRADPNYLEQRGFGGILLNDGIPGTTSGGNISLTYDKVEGSLATDGSTSMEFNNIGTLSRAPEALDGQTHVILFSYDGPTGYMDAWYDGMKNYKPSIFSFAAYATNNWGCSNSLIVGSYSGAQEPFIGDIGCVGIFSNVWTDAQLADLAKRATLEYNIQPPSAVYLVGASIMQGTYAWDNGGYTGYGFQKMLARAFTGMNAYQFAAGGRTTLCELTNEQTWLATADTLSRQKYAIIGSDMVLNDVYESQGVGSYANMNQAQTAVQIPLSESNVVMICSNMVSHHIVPILSTMPSWSGETNLSKNLYNAWVSNNWSAYAAGLFSWPSAMTVDGSWNSAYFIDGIHPYYSGYALASNNIVSALSQVLLVSQTPGVLVSVQPANSVLNQLTSLDDYMSIDQQSPYDVATTLLPAINGSYYGYGKLDLPGNTGFYFDPPRWPMFQWSGFTNQVIYEHIFVTNAATVSWTAYVRYFTNGFTLAGNGAQNKQFAAGVLQCPVGTNDYWIIATNNWPVSTMTNVTFAEFLIYNGSPSSNFWAIEGTRIHAQ